MVVAMFEETPPENVQALENCCAERFRKFEESVRRSPGAYVAGAAALGYLLQFLPVGWIFGGLFRILLTSIRPALLILGLFKVVECAQQKCAAKRCLAQLRGEDREPLVDSPTGPPAA